MTDNEIKKAWEDEIHLAEYVDSDFCNGVSLSLVKSTLDLINRYEAENEGLIAGQETLQKGMAEKNKEITRLQGIILAFMDEVAKLEDEGIDVSRFPLIPICDEGRNAIDKFSALAIKEFVERLSEDRVANDPVVIAAKCLLNELVGDNK